MTGWESLADALPSDSDRFGGQYLNRLSLLLTGNDISATDATLKPIIGTDWRFRSGNLYLNDVNNDNTVQLLIDNQSVNTVAKIPTQSFTPDYIVLRKQTEELENKTIDANKNSFLNLPAWSRTATETLQNKTIDAALNTLKQTTGFYYTVYLDANDANKCKARNNNTGLIDSSNTDPTVVIQFALTNSGVGKGAVFLEAGTYQTTSRITIPSNTRLIGNGRDTTIIQASASSWSSTPTAHLLENVDTTNGNVGIRIEGITLDGNTKGITSLYLECVSKSVIRDCRFTGNGGGAVISIWWHGNIPAEFGGTGAVANYNLFEGNIVEENTAGADVFGGGRLTDSVIQRNMFIGNTSNTGPSGICVQTNAIRLGIFNNVIEGSGAAGISLEGGHHCVVSGNIISNCVGGGVQFPRSPAAVNVAGSPYGDGNESIIANNRVTKCLYGVLSPGQTSVIVGNLCQSNQQMGIQLVVGTGDYLGHTCNSNFLLNNGQNTGTSAAFRSGIYTTAAVKCTVQANICIDTQVAAGGTATQQYGIYEGNTSDYNNIFANILDANVTAAVRPAGNGHTKIQNNIGYVTRASGLSATQNGNGSTTVFNIAHGLAATPTYVNAHPASSDARGNPTFSATSTNIVITYPIAPESGTNNLQWYYVAEVYS